MLLTKLSGLKPEMSSGEAPTIDEVLESVDARESRGLESEPPAPWLAAVASA